MSASDLLPEHARHRSRLLGTWLAGEPLASALGRRDHTLPRGLIDALPALEAALDGLARIESEHPSRDGSTRLVLRLRDGRTVESVLLARGAVCVSTQVGCAVGCTFCMTGRAGLARQLEPLEILAQVALARRRRPVRRVVLMGMGEPAHNLDAVREALRALGQEGRLGHKELVFSTVGDRRAFERLAADAVRPALALSLHTTDAELRARLLPRAPRIAPDELIELADVYARATGHPVQYQWTLLDGVNDGDDEIERLGRWMQGRKGMVNFIPWNPVEGTGHARTPIARAHALARRLSALGIVTRVRFSAGQDVEGACGQLGARALAARA